MSTEKQINANRQNAQKSTGPKTDEGKAAVSQNAVKHGLFAESVITGENEADYEAFHDEMLAELAPVGAVESALAERVVNLWWRLRRAERMQNQAIDEMIEHQIDNPLSKSIRMINLHAKGVKMGDPRYLINHLQLGRIATYDWSNHKVLDRMMLYERRIENSVVKLMKELKRFQVIRQIERQDAEEQFEPSPRLRSEPALSLSKGQAPSLRDEAATQKLAGAATRRMSAEKKVDLKKQSQFVPGLNGATSCVKGDYDNIPLCGAQKNKAKQSQYNRSPQGVPRTAFGVLSSSQVT
jgi:hypothetical protein